MFFSGFCLGTSNYGTAIRHRQKWSGFLAIPAAIGLAWGPGHGSGLILRKEVVGKKITGYFLFQEFSSYSEGI